MSTATPITIGFARSFAFGIPFWTIAEHGARERARELDAHLLVRHCNDDREMAAAITGLVQQRVHVLIIAPMDPLFPPFRAALAQARAANIPIVAIDVPLADLSDCTVRSDDLRGAADAAAYLADRIQGRGTVLHLQGELAAPVAQLRSQGVHQVLDTYPAVTLIETDQGRWSREITAALVRDLLAEHPQIAGVIAANDPMALGALDALSAAGRLEGVAVLGVDGDPDALLEIEAGTLAATVRRSPHELGRTGVDMAFALTQGAAVPTEVLLDDMTLVTAANVARAAITALRIAPGVIDDLMANSAAMAAERTMLRTIIDSLPDIMYVKDAHGRFEVANQALAQLLGVASPELLIGKSDFDLFPPQLATQYQADERTLMQSGLPLVNKEEPVVHADGTAHWIITTKVPLRDAQGQVTRLVGRGQDITERKQAEAEQQRLQAELMHMQAQTLQELSTPLIPISDTVLVMPLVGRIDTRRAEQILETLLTGIQTQSADLAIIDITGVDVVDTQVAQALLQAARAVKLLGAQVVLTGLRPEVAQTLVSLGVNLGDIVTRSTLQSGIAYGLRKA